MVSLYVLSGPNKNMNIEVWIKHIRFIGRGFCIGFPSFCHMNRRQVLPTEGEPGSARLPLSLLLFQQSPHSLPIPGRNGYSEACLRHRRAFSICCHPLRSTPIHESRQVQGRFLCPAALREDQEEAQALLLALGAPVARSALGQSARFTRLARHEEMELVLGARHAERGCGE